MVFAVARRTPIRLTWFDTIVASGQCDARKLASIMWDNVVVLPLSSLSIPEKLSLLSILTTEEPNDA